MKTCTKCHEKLALDKFRACGGAGRGHLDMQPEWLGKEFRSDSGKKCCITGYNTRAKKFPVEAKEINSDQIYKYTVEAIIRYMTRES